MTYRDRQRLRSAQARRPAPQKWPETMAELTSLPASTTASAVSDPAAVRARLVQNTQQALKALQATQSERTRLAAQRAGDLRSRQQLLNAPYLSLTGRGPLQISTPPAAQRSLFNSNQDSIPSPEPGPPPDYGQQTPEPSPAPQPNQMQGTVAYSKYGMIDPGVAIAQQIMEKRNKDLQEWGQTAAIASALGLPVPPVPDGQSQGSVKQVKTSSIGFADPELLDAEQVQKGIPYGMIDPGLQMALDYEALRNRIKNPVYFSQKDAQWSGTSYGSGTIASSGCGPTSMAMVVSTLTGKTVTPEVLSKFAEEKGQKSDGGTAHSFYALAGAKYGINVTMTVDDAEMLDAVKDGQHMVIVGVSNANGAHFTGGGHLMVITGVEYRDGKPILRIYDPNSGNKRYHNKKIDGIEETSTSGIIYVDVDTLKGAAQHYWICGKAGTPMQTLSSGSHNNAQPGTVAPG